MSKPGTIWSDPESLQEYQQWLEDNDLRDSDKNRLRFTRQELKKLVDQGKIYQDSDGGYYPVIPKKEQH